MSIWLIVLLLTPLLGAGLMLTGLPARLIALASAAVSFALSIGVAFQFNPAVEGFQGVLRLPWLVVTGLPPVMLHIGVDGVNLALVLLTTTVMLAAVAVAPASVKRPRLYYSCLLLIGGGALGAFLSLDLLLLYVFHELALIPTFLMIGLYGAHDRKFAATQITIYLMVGSVVLLAGLLMFYYLQDAPHRTLDLVDLATRDSSGPLDAQAQVWIYPVLLLGFGILVSLWPFHSWAPLAYASAPAPVAMLHAGVLKKFGLYGLLRLVGPYLDQGLFHWNAFLALFIVGNILVIGWVTLSQRQLGMMLGFSSVMHMGMLFLAVAASVLLVDGELRLNQLALTGAVILMVGHGLSAALLFGLAGEIRRMTGTLQFLELGGLASRAPKLTFLFMVGALASIGLPGLANFAGELMIFFGAWAGAQQMPNLYILVAVALWGVVLSAVYMLRAVRWIFFGPVSRVSESVADFRGWKEVWPWALLAAALLWVGLFPGVLVSWCANVLVGEVR